MGRPQSCAALPGREAGHLDSQTSPRSDSVRPKQKCRDLDTDLLEKVDSVRFLVVKLTVWLFDWPLYVGLERHLRAAASPGVTLTVIARLPKGFQR
jgi:hypothetical protein